MNEYYGKYIEVSYAEQEILLDIYEEIAREQNFQPDYEERELVDLNNDERLLTTVLYHVESFGSDKPGYDSIAHLFEI